jgi:hypothetical protein
MPGTMPTNRCTSGFSNTSEYTALKRSFISAYSSSAAAGSMFTDHRFSAIEVTRGPEGARPKRPGMRSWVFSSHTSVRRPAAAEAAANRAVTVDLPTPPLPVTSRKRRSINAGSSDKRAQYL